MHHRERWAWLLAGLLCLALLLSWWQPITHGLDNLAHEVTGSKKPDLSKAQAKLATVKTLTPTTAIVSKPGTAGSGTASGSTGSSGSGGSGTTTTTPTTSTGGGATISSSGGSTTGPGQTSNSQLFTQISPGQNMNNVVTLAGTPASNCTSAQLTLLGTQQVCAWMNNGTGVGVTFLNGQVVSKIPLGF